ncbi:hypothetical protein TNCV_639121 [Trichonephila clavipes]|nr:hypothetical protein TNCV_639121 [Trichonephila clavipes]
MQHHGVGRHHDQWPHAPTCGCEWDYDGPTMTLMKFYFLMFVFFRGAVDDKFVFMDDNATCHRTLAVQDWSRQRGYSTSRSGRSAFSRSKTPLKMCGMLWGRSSCWSKLSSRQTRTPSSVQS